MSVAPLFPEDTIRQVAAASDIAEVAGAYLTLRRTGAIFTALCPFHQEKTPSFVVTPARQTFKCFGCGAGGDVIHFVAQVENLRFPEAVRRLAERAGIQIEGSGSGSSAVAFHNPPARSKLQVKRPEASPLRLPADLHQGSRAELRAVAERRGLSAEGVTLASERGLLGFGSVCGLPSWLVKDQAGILAQGRRMDGVPYPAFKGLVERKAHTLGGSRQSWPLGARESDAHRCVVLVEGGPDLLAACHFIAAEGREADVAAVAVLGASNLPPEDALLSLSNKRVRIFPHLDAAGRAWAVSWAEALERVGCEVDAFNFSGLLRADGRPVEDLNDLALVDADCFEAERAELSEVLPR